METSIVTTLLNSLPGIITGVITGIIILVVEYKTGWFIKNRRERTGNIGSNFPNSIPRSGIHRTFGFGTFGLIDLTLQIMMFLLVFMMVFLVIGLPISFILNDKRSTILDNSESLNIAVKNIGVGDTKTFYNNDFFTTLNDVVSDNEVSFTVGQVGLASQYIERARNGTAMVYSANGIKYDVRITSVSYAPMFGKDSADFTVTILP